MKIEYLQGSNVISIAPVRNEQHFPAIAQVEAYWEGLRNGRVMPTRADVDPRGISDILEYAFVLEKIAPGMARIRLAGMHMNDLLGMEVRGMPITALFLPEGRRAIQRALETVFDRPATARLTLSSDTGFTRPAMDGQLFLAPLRGEDGKPTRILGALQTNGKIGRSPRRFTVRDTEFKHLLDEAPLTPRETAEKRIPGFAEAAKGFQQAAETPTQPQSTKSTSYLRLVTDNEA
ncbi:PAS domain-containing protein [Aliiroseovarius subalbicans]|uniref:PAS domain-containing protein n=1 Tax=Aliiroseovarius subalbicans TaxID=2925840 RepID=UPI001F5AC043|nr:PAS domain-containing protein [Aliiroseovarius subalbicans]MCI2398336.1 PAS domain-containing protein [Aliiroseovarius subalbicans]